MFRIILAIIHIITTGGVYMDFNEQDLKYEVAKELGLLEKVMQYGWRGLSPKETGKIGGLVTKKKKSMSAKSDIHTSQKKQA